MCPVLNFSQQHIAKDKDSIIQTAAKFFGKDAIKHAIEACKRAFQVDIFENRRGSHPAMSFLSYIYELIRGLVQRDEPPLLFDIVDPSDLPPFPNDAPMIVASSQNKCLRMLNFLVEQHEIFSQVPVSTVWPLSSSRQPTTVPVVLTNILSNINVQNPKNQCVFVQKIGSVEVCRLVMHLINEESATAAVTAIPLHQDGSRL